MRIAHVSDLHFGRIAFPEIISDLVRDIREADVSLVAVSGDLTQRALPWQFDQAIGMLEAFLSPVIVVPGNHDVYPWWRPFARVTRPLKRYYRFLGEGYSEVFSSDEVAILGINSAHGRTIKGGKIDRYLESTVDAFFSASAPGAFKILMLHHHLVALAGVLPHDVARGGAALFEVVCKAGVSLILCGHLHVSHVESLQCSSGNDIVIASAGTATSDRGRRSNKRRNFYNIIDVHPEFFDLEERTYNPEEHVFRVEKRSRFDR